MILLRQYAWCGAVTVLLQIYSYELFCTLRVYIIELFWYTVWLLNASHFCFLAYLQYYKCLVNYFLQHHVKTSCCSTDGDRPYRCCRLWITAGTFKLPLPMGDPGPNMVPRAHPSPHLKWHLESRSVQPFLYGSELCPTDTQNAEYR